MIHLVFTRRALGGLPLRALPLLEKRVITWSQSSVSLPQRGIFIHPNTLKLYIIVAEQRYRGDSTVEKLLHYTHLPIFKIHF